MLIVLHFGRQGRFVDGLFELEVAGVIGMALHASLHFLPPVGLRNFIKQQVCLHVIVAIESVRGSYELFDVVVQGLDAAEGVKLGVAVDEQLGKTSVVQQGESGSFEIYAGELCALPGLQEAADLEVAISVDELVVEGERDDISVVALLQNFIQTPYSQIYLCVSLSVLLPSSQELVEASSEHYGHYLPVHLLLQGFQWLIWPRLIQTVFLGRQVYHIGNADTLTTHLAPQLPGRIPYILVMEWLRLQLGSFLAQGRLDKTQFDARGILKRV